MINYGLLLMTIIWTYHFFFHYTHNLACRTVIAKHMRKVCDTNIIEKKINTSTYLKIKKIKKERRKFTHLVKILK